MLKVYPTLVRRGERQEQTILDLKAACFNMVTNDVFMEGDLILKYGRRGVCTEIIVCFLEERMGLRDGASMRQHQSGKNYL